MLEGARFGEGVALRDATPSNPARVSLPDDDPAAMETICRVIHSRALDAAADVGASRPGILDASPGEVLAVAVLADKYDCAPAMALAAEHWLRPEAMEDVARSGHICPRRRDLLIAAYWFKHERGFEAGSRRLLAEVSGSFRPLAEDRGSLDENIALRVAREFGFSHVFPHIGVITLDSDTDQSRVGGAAERAPPLPVHLPDAAHP
ncbi:hypothetical protein LZ32DRAFT_540907 [Colletotrichum eremochloae]|nr:hypothetical protein LZ32DRAFT_540907 [Colletotrichum eremochloae]